ncbi:unnamed protein product [Camellia sinensis]
MHIGGWFSSGKRPTVRCQSFRETSETEYDRFLPVSLPVTGSKVPIWIMMWRKIKKPNKNKRMIKKKSFEHSTTMKFSYDPNTYSQNFEEGSIWDDLDDGLSRSFSARFAVPSRIFQKSEGIDGLMG